MANQSRPDTSVAANPATPPTAKTPNSTIRKFSNHPLLSGPEARQEPKKWTKNSMSRSSYQPKNEQFKSDRANTSGTQPQPQESNSPRYVIKAAASPAPESYWTTAKSTNPTL